MVGVAITHSAQHGVHVATSGSLTVVLVALFVEAVKKLSAFTQL